MVVSFERINIITDQGINTGIGRYAYSLYCLLKDEFPNIVLYQLSYFKSSQIPSARTVDFLKQADKLIEVPIIKYHNFHKLKANGTFKEENIHLCGTDYSLSSVSRNCIATIHDYYLRIPNFKVLKDVRTLSSELYIDYYNTILPSHLKRCKLIVVDSVKVQNEIRRKLGLAGVVIPLWIGDRFKLGEKTIARKKLNLPVDATLLLNVSGGGANKNLPTLERLSKILPEKIELVKIGFPLSSEKVINRREVTEEDYPSYFNACDMYINTSITEGFGIPLIEAMVSGMPVISSMNEPFVEILGDAGIFVNNQINEYDYLDAVKSLLDPTTYDVYKRRSINRGEAFSSEHARDKIVDLYKEVFNL